MMNRELFCRRTVQSTEQGGIPMFAIFSPIPNWNYASPLELIVWVITMSLAALFGVWCFFAFTQDRVSSKGHEFRGTFLFAAALAMFVAAILVASRGHT